jgi:alpha,alpha-trehalase
LAAFSNFTNSSSVTTEDIVEFVDNYFEGEGLELAPVALKNFNVNPAFLNNASVTLVKAFAQTVHGYWTQLIRQTNSSSLCNGTSCESTLIPLNHTFVVPGACL